MDKIPQLKDWISTLKSNLNKDIKDDFQVYLYLLKNEFIQAYPRSSKDKNEEFVSKIINASKITELPPIFPLEEENLKVFGIDINKDITIGTTGEFAYYVLILKIKENIYCFYFLDSNEELRQGYLRFYRENIEKEMINILKKEGVESLFEKYKIKSENELFQTGINFEIIIHNLEEAPENKENKMEIDQKKIMNLIKSSMDEMKKSIVKNKRRFSYSVIGDDDIKIEKIPTKKRKASFSKGDKEKEEQEENKKEKKGIISKVKNVFKKK